MIRKLVVTLTGPSASGKSHLERDLLAQGYARVISMTTRSPREGEKDGLHYYFRTLAQAEEMILNGELLEYNTFTSPSGPPKLYGVPLFEMERALASGRPAVVVVEPNGAKAIRTAARERGWTSLSVFLDAELDLALKRFLIRYKQDAMMTPEVAAERIQTILGEEQRWREHMTWDLLLPAYAADTEAEILRAIDSAVRARLSLLDSSPLIPRGENTLDRTARDQLAQLRQSVKPRSLFKGPSHG